MIDLLNTTIRSLQLYSPHRRKIVNKLIAFLVICILEYTMLKSSDTAK